MNILLITSTFPTSFTDPQVGWLGDMVQRLHQAGHAVDVLAPSFRGIPQTDYFGVPVYRFRYAPARWEVLTHDEGAVFKLRERPWLGILAGWYVISGLCAVVIKTWNVRYDVIHVQWPFPQGLFGIAAKFLTHGRLVFSFHGAEFTLARRVPGGDAILGMMLRHADAVSANSTYTKHSIQRLRSVSVHILPFGATVGPMSGSLHEKFSGKKNMHRILFVGRLIDRKGVEYLVRAMPMVLRKRKVTLDIVGDGSLYTHLSHLVKHLHIGDAVHFHRQINRRQLATLYAGCDVFVLPSITDHWGDTEGLGVVLIEALSFHKPVIASRVGGIPDIIQHKKTGYLVSEKNSPLLAEAILWVLSHDKSAREMGKRGYQHVQTMFDWNTIMNKLLKIYQKESYAKN